MEKFGIGKMLQKKMEMGGRKKRGREIGRIQRAQICYSQHTTHDNFLTSSPHSQSLSAAFSPKYSSRPPPPIPSNWESSAPAVVSGQLWTWSLLPPGGNSEYCQRERWERRTSHQWEDQFGGDTRFRRLSEKGSTKTQGE